MRRLRMVLVLPWVVFVLIACGVPDSPGAASPATPGTQALTSAPNATPPSVAANDQASAHVLRVFNDLPLPEGAKQLDQKSGVMACDRAWMSALYVADTAWDDVVAFYENYMQTAGWANMRWIEYVGDGAHLVAEWPFDPQQQYLTFSVRRVTTVSPMNEPYNWPEGNDTVREAVKSAKTAYAIGINYMSDVPLYNSTCKD